MNIADKKAALRVINFTLTLHDEEFWRLILEREWLLEDLMDETEDFDRLPAYAAAMLAVGGERVLDWGEKGYFDFSEIHCEGAAVSVCSQYLTPLEAKESYEALIENGKDISDPLKCTGLYFDACHALGVWPLAYQKVLDLREEEISLKSQHFQSQSMPKKLRLSAYQMEDIFSKLRVKRAS
ncbi:MAG: hypothetical protein EOP06_11545 [Proteobacteria bacterium]|nr:MAG: hypothetical protein EOP06_11545 [Pseudomonadota bacterium]